ncbi:MAG TPA: hypothetical protein VGM90_10440 [Kofleriaceae bacterium]|jgi:hypothetical protein
MRWAWVLLAGCGRIDFDGRLADAPIASDVRVDAPAPIMYAQSVVATGFNGSTTTFTFTPMHVGDAVLIQVGCFGNSSNPLVALVAPGWTFEPLGALMAGPGQFAQTLAAIVPDLTPVTVTETWTNISCGSGGAIGDELTNVDPTGGAVTFDAHVETSGVGDCSADITTGNDNDAIWAGCQSNASVLSVGPGFTKRTDDGGDWTETKVTTDPAGTVEHVTFGNTAGQGFSLGVVTVKLGG